MAVALIILGAGKGTRMQSDLPKVMHEIGGAPMLVHAIKAGEELEPSRIVVVAGHGADVVEAGALDWNPMTQVVLQKEQLGTAHAVAQAKDILGSFEGNAIVLYGDTPFISAQTLEAMIDARATSDVVVLGFDAEDPATYGRLVMDGDSLERIVEFKDASPQERRISLCNSGVVCADAKVLFELIEAVGNDNASGEYYLTDIVSIARQSGRSAGIVICDEEETMGVNSRAELARAEAIFQNFKRLEAFDNGVTLQAPDAVIFAHDTFIGRDTVIEPNVVFGNGVSVESGARIRAFSHLEGCHVSSGAVVGPYARLRPGAELGEDVKVGNFVEIKNAVLETGAKVNHLSYVGDASIGAAANLGAGTITCNYDGVFKHHTDIGARAFIGSNTMLVAPVRVGADAMTASGSVITQDVPDADLAIARAKQDNKTGLGKRLMDKLRAAKAKRSEGK